MPLCGDGGGGTGISGGGGGGGGASSLDDAICRCCQRKDHYVKTCPDDICFVCKGTVHCKHMCGTVQSAVCAAVSLPLDSDVDTGVEVKAFMTTES